MALKTLKRKQIRLMLKEVNSSSRTNAVLVRCVHFSNNPFGYVLMSVATMIKHCAGYECRPERISETIEAMELKANGQHAAI